MEPKEQSKRPATNTPAGACDQKLQTQRIQERFGALDQPQFFALRLFDCKEDGWDG